MVMAPFIALLVLGQTTTTTQAPNTIVFTVNGQPDALNLNATSCNDTPTVTWTSTTTGIYPCTALQLWSSNGTCGDAPASGDVTYPQVPQTAYATKTGPFTVVVSELPAFSSTDAGYECGASGVELKTNLCGSVKIAPTADCASTFYPAQIIHTNPFTIIYDTKPPTAPVLKPLVSLDSELLAQFTVTPDTVTVHAYLKGPADTDYSEYGTVSDTASSVRITGLANATTYSVYLKAEDASGNVSGASNIEEGTPIETFGFWSNYRGSGGASQGGCAATGFELSLAAMLVWVGRVVWRKRR